MITLTCITGYRNTETKEVSVNPYQVTYVEPSNHEMPEQSTCYVHFPNAKLKVQGKAEIIAEKVEKATNRIDTHYD